MDSLTTENYYLVKDIHLHADSTKIYERLHLTYPYL